jgi:hypothetical protein
MKKGEKYGRRGLSFKWYEVKAPMPCDVPIETRDKKGILKHFHGKDKQFFPCDELAQFEVIRAREVGDGRKKGTWRTIFVCPVHAGAVRNDDHKPFEYFTWDKSPRIKTKDLTAAYSARYGKKPVEKKR